MPNPTTAFTTPDLYRRAPAPAHDIDCSGAMPAVPASSVAPVIVAPSPGFVQALDDDSQGFTQLPLYGGPCEIAFKAVCLFVWVRLCLLWSWLSADDDRDDDTGYGWYGPFMLPVSGSPLSKTVTLLIAFAAFCLLSALIGPKN